jgi:DNA-binding transcriptional ArsR family regulator
MLRMATPTDIDPQVAALRAFNRFYTRRIGVLDEKLYGSGFTLPRSRVLWELAHHEGLTATELARLLDLDPGYLSRLLAGLKERRLIRARRCSRSAQRGAARSRRSTRTRRRRRPRCSRRWASRAAASCCRPRARSSSCSVRRAPAMRPCCCALTAPATSAG